MSKVTYFLDEKFETQRYWWDLSQWLDRTMPTDPAPVRIVTTRLDIDAATGKPTTPPSRRDLADELLFLSRGGKDGGPRPVNEWVVYDGPDSGTGEGGWLYAVDPSHFDSSFWSTSKTARMRDYVRRRELLRLRKIDGADAAALDAAASVAADEKSEGKSSQPKSSAAAPVASAAAGGGTVFRVHNETVRSLFMGIYVQREQGIWKRSGAPTEVGFGKALQITHPDTQPSQQYAVALEAAQLIVRTVPPALTRRTRTRWHCAFGVPPAYLSRLSPDCARVGAVCVCVYRI
jgi:hypothetical protein